MSTLDPPAGDAATPPRDDIETTSPARQAQCPTCGARFRRVRRQRYCSPACRQAAWRARHHDPLAQATPGTVPAPPARRRDVTVYTCPDCEERYLGRQWCPDCNRPCTRTGIGGLCPACEHPLAVDELLSRHDAVGFAALTVPRPSPDGRPVGGCP